MAANGNPRLACTLSCPKHKNYKTWITNPLKTDKMGANGNLRLCLKSKPQTKSLSKVSLELTSMINLGRRGARAPILDIVNKLLGCLEIVIPS